MSSLYDWTEMTKIGVGLTSMGIFFTILGVMLFLDSAMLTLGNLLFIVGVTLVMGPQRAKAFFFARPRWRASACFFTGTFLVLIGWCFLGLLIQGFGGLNLFGNFFPMVVRILENLPVIGTFLRLPFVQAILEKVGLQGGQNRSV